MRPRTRTNPRHLQGKCSSIWVKTSHAHQFHTGIHGVSNPGFRPAGISVYQRENTIPGHRGIVPGKYGNLRAMYLSLPWESSSSVHSTRVSQLFLDQFSDDAECVFSRGNTIVSVCAQGHPGNTVNCSANAAAFERKQSENNVFTLVFAMFPGPFCAQRES